MPDGTVAKRRYPRFVSAGRLFPFRGAGTTRDIGGDDVLAKVYSCAVVGLDGVLVEVEVDVGQGQPRMVVVGLPDAAGRESQDRVRAAIRNSGG